MSQKMVKCEVSSWGIAPALWNHHGKITCSRMEKTARKSRLELDQIRFLPFLATRETICLSMESQILDSVQNRGPIRPDRFTDSTPS
jgi:hypothetical protein